MWGSLLRSWREAGPPQRFAYGVGTGLILVGLAHLAAWLVVGGIWAGPVSFRKPTTITLAWVTGRLGPERPQVAHSACSED